MLALKKEFAMIRRVYLLGKKYFFNKGNFLNKRESFLS